MTVFFDTDIERLQQLGLGGAIAVVIIGMVLAFLAKRTKDRHPAIADKSGERSVTEWQMMISDIVRECINEQIIPLMSETRSDQVRINDVLRERLHTIMNVLQRIDAIVSSNRTPVK